MVSGELISLKNSLEKKSEIEIGFGMKSLLSIYFILLLNSGLIAQASGLEICGVELIDESSKVVVCNNSLQDIDISCYSMSVSKKRFEILTYWFPPNTIVKAEGLIELDPTFLDFPFKKNGNEKFKKYYLFDADNLLVSKMKLSRSRV